MLRNWIVIDYGYVEAGLLSWGFGDYFELRSLRKFKVFTALTLKYFIVEDGCFLGIWGKIYLLFEWLPRLLNVRYLVEFFSKMPLFFEIFEWLHRIQSFWGKWQTICLIRRLQTGRNIWTSGDRSGVEGLYSSVKGKFDGLVKSVIWHFMLRQVWAWD